MTQKNVKVGGMNCHITPTVQVLEVAHAMAKLWDDVDWHNTIINRNALKPKNRRHKYAIDYTCLLAVGILGDSNTITPIHADGR